MVKNFNQMSFEVICSSHNTESGEQARPYPTPIHYDQPLGAQPPDCFFRPWVVYLNQQHIVTPFKANGCQRLSTVCVRVVLQCFYESSVYLNYCTEFLYYIIFKGQDL